MWMKDVGLAFRVLRKQPGFTVTVVAMVALGVGATTALFGVFRSVFLQPLSVPDADRVVFVLEQGGFGCCGPASGPDYLDWVERERSFEGMVALSPRSANLATDGSVERVYGTRVTANAFPLLEAVPLMGRALDSDDARGTAQVVVLGHGLWQRSYGGDPEIVGSSVHIDGEPYTVVGVMPEGFDVPSPWGLGVAHQFFLPFPDESLESNRGSHGFPVFARLTEGTTIEEAQGDMERIMRELAQAYPLTNGDRTARVFAAHDYLYGDLGRQLGLILGAAIVVLLIACGNIAALQLARAAGRGSELSLRAALGAPRRAVIRLLFTESGVLALVGGAVGIFVAMAAMRGFKLMIPSTVPRTEDVALDGTVLLVALVASIGAALAFGMLPALASSRTNLATGVREGGHATTAPGKERLRDVFIVGQIALGLILANGAGLLVRSYTTLMNQEYGFDSDNVLTMVLAPGGSRYPTPADAGRYFDDVVDRVRALPGVTSAGVITRLPLYGGSNGNVWIEGRPPRANAGEGPLVEVTSVAGDYFEVMGIPILQGRELLPEDADSASAGVVINQTLAQEAWPDEDPIGKRFSFSDNPPIWTTVVGVVGDVRQWSPERPPVGHAYYPYARGWSNTQGYLTVKTAVPPTSLGTQVRDAIRQVDPSIPGSEVMSMDDRVDRWLAQRRFYTTIIGLFAVAALLLAAAGIYGTVSYYVARRNRDLGIRMALGAAGTGIMGLIVVRGVRLAFYGVLIGLVGVWASGRVLESLVYGVSTTDALTLLLGCGILAGTAVAASILPALRAVRVPPVLALRTE